ncbi:glycogen synthase GlgA [Candidatus Sumerlaeota bacterium]|nr:glycogen synthase GlgA [Candidatus Sumerlaeota bacterium]
MNILLASSEVVPFAKTGGLADVSGALPRALHALGHDVRVILPFYRAVSEEKFRPRSLLPEMIVQFPGNWQVGSMWETTFPGSEIPVYLVRHDHYFDRDGLYGEKGDDYPDNAERFSFFCMAALWTLKGIGWQPDVIHCNDWQTALIPTYLRNLPIVRSDPFYGSIGAVFTVHNLAYQGRFGPAVLERIGLDLAVYHPEGLEFYGAVNLLKAGIVYADALTTVSRQYAKEIQTEEFGCGLDGILRAHADRLHGIMNGIDYSLWNPELDEFTASHYWPTNMAGKARCKEALQKDKGLPQDASIPLIGMISRLDSQKGFDLLAESLDDIMALDVQMVILGTGDPACHEMLEEATKQYPHRLSVDLTFNNALAHQIEAGADMFLMPSRFEPCGLNQLISMKYGTAPIVRKVGGLADSIVNATIESVRKGQGTGFVFEAYDPNEMLKAVKRAVSMYREKPELWARLVQNAMAQVFSWDVSARAYEGLFRQVWQERQERFLLH